VSEFDENEAFAILLTNLGKTKRNKNLLIIAECCVRLKERYGSWGKLAKKIVINNNRAHIDEETLREYGTIVTLPGEIKQLIEDGKITSMDKAFRISTLDERKDQIALAKAIVQRNLYTSDVRAIVEYKKKNPGVTLKQTIDRVLASKTRFVTYHVIVMELQKKTVEALKKEAKNLKKTSEELIFMMLNERWKKTWIISFGMRGDDIIFKLSEDGFRTLQKMAETMHIQLKDLADKELWCKLSLNH